MGWKTTSKSPTNRGIQTATTHWHTSFPICLPNNLHANILKHDMDLRVFAEPVCVTGPRRSAADHQGRGRRAEPGPEVALSAVSQEQGSWCYSMREMC